MPPSISLDQAVFLNSLVLLCLCLCLELCWEHVVPHAAGTNTKKCHLVDNGNLHSLGLCWPEHDSDLRGLPRWGVAAATGLAGVRSAVLQRLRQSPCFLPLIFFLAAPTAAAVLPALQGWQSHRTEPFSSAPLKSLSRRHALPRRDLMHRLTCGVLHVETIWSR